MVELPLKDDASPWSPRERHTSFPRSSVETQVGLENEMEKVLKNRYPAHDASIVDNKGIFYGPYTCGRR